MCTNVDYIVNATVKFDGCLSQLLTSQPILTSSFLFHFFYDGKATVDMMEAPKLPGRDYTPKKLIR